MTFDEAMNQVRENLQVPMNRQQSMLYCGDPQSLDGPVTRKLISVAASIATNSGRTKIKGGPFFVLSNSQLRSIESECGFKIINSGDYLFESILVARFESDDKQDYFPEEIGFVDVRKEVELVEI